MTFSLTGLNTITNNQYEPACGILSLLDILINCKTNPLMQLEASASYESPDPDTIFLYLLLTESNRRKSLPVFPKI